MGLKITPTDCGYNLVSFEVQKNSFRHGKISKIVPDYDFFLNFYILKVSSP
jgi:hypothetical protein